jgi:plasmid stabilization system protein ParE
LSDLQRIHTYISEYNSEAATRVIGIIEKRTLTLSSHPSMGYASDEPNVRIILAIPYPYRVYYRAKADEIEIVHIRHTSRRPPGPGQL